MVRFGKALVVIALAISLGASWALLQSVAWLGMVVTYSQGTCLRVAVAKTFDGKHPCTLCKVVREGQQSQKENPAVSFHAKLDGLLFQVGDLIFLPMSTTNEPGFTYLGFVGLALDSPPTPPPRFA